VSQRILIVEDDHKLGLQILERLRGAGYAPHWLDEGRLLSRAELDTYSLVILDLMLPGIYGMDVLKDLRAQSDVPVLVLSARIETSDKIRALKLGADDYITKPFWPEELIERVRARLRRPALARGAGIEIGSLFIDTNRREVLVDRQRVELTRSEFDVLALLAEQPGVAITRRGLAERVLAADRDSCERTLDVHISRLRRKLGPRVSIETVWGIGYRLRAEQES
jgi:two-component system response regulator MtrA